MNEIIQWGLIVLLALRVFKEEIDKFKNKDV